MTQGDENLEAQGDAVQKEAAQWVLCDVLEALRVVAVLLSPVTPNLSRNILLQLGLSEAAVEQLRFGDAAWGGGHLF